MQQGIKRWVLRLSVTVAFIAALLLVIILHPILIYAHKTTHNNLTIYHATQLNPTIITTLDDATSLLKQSEFYNPNFRLDICLNDGSLYTKLMRKLRGPAFAWGFYDKVVLQGTANYEQNNVALNGYQWNLTQLLAHEMTHCLQFHHLGLWQSKPLADIPNWKWEGYAEYIARKSADQRALSKNIDRLVTTNKDSWEVIFPDSTIAPRTYYESWILMQFCMNIKKMTYKDLLTDTTSEPMIRQEMLHWYEERKKG